MAKNKISINDIAQSLGVSKTLVSLVLNNKSDAQGISKISQQRVWDKVKELNYKPNLMARSLRLGKSNTIGLIVSDISNPFYSKMARHIEDIAEKNGYNLIICSTDEKIEKEIDLIKMLKNRQVDGLIISSSQKNGTDFTPLLKENFPFILIDRCIPKLKANYVTVDNVTGAFEAVDHLIKQGYDKVAAFAISPVHVSTISERINGYTKALQSNKRTYGNAFIKEIPFNTVKTSVKNELKKILEGKNKANAVFAVNNNIAIACLEAFTEMRICVPDELALVCFDDIDLFKLTSPSITAVAQPLEEICKSAAGLLFNEINHNGALEKKHITLSTKLIIRRSSVL